VAVVAHDCGPVADALRRAFGWQQPFRDPGVGEFGLTNAESWRWAGPSWTGQVPGYVPGGVTGLTIEVKDPSAAAQRWAAVLGVSAGSDGSTPVVQLSSGQQLRFTPAEAGHGEGITAVIIAGLPGGRPLEIGGVRFAGEGAGGGADHCFRPGCVRRRLWRDLVSHSAGGQRQS
jgi:hypothetical protein